MTVPNTSVVFSNRPMSCMTSRELSLRKISGALTAVSMQKDARTLPGIPTQQGASWRTLRERKWSEEAKR